MNYKNLLNIYFFLAFLFTAQPCDTFNMTDAAKPLSTAVPSFLVLLPWGFGAVYK